MLGLLCGRLLISPCSASSFVPQPQAWQQYEALAGSFDEQASQQLQEDVRGLTRMAAVSMTEALLVYHFQAIPVEDTLELRKQARIAMKLLQDYPDAEKELQPLLAKAVQKAIKMK